MSPFGLSKLGALAFSVESLCGRLRGKKRGRQAQKTRRLLFDPLEQRQLLSVSPVQTTDTLVNNAVGATGQTTELTTGGVGTYNLPLDNQSVATDDNGDFVVTWTSYNPLINPNTGKQVISATGAPVVEGNIYARYYTDDVQRITLPSAILTQHASGTYGSFQLVYNGSEQQELAITATTAPFGGPVDLAGTFRLGFDPNGKAPTPSEQVTISYNETDPLQTTAGDIQTALSGLGGPLTDVSVSAVDARHFLINFGPAEQDKVEPLIVVDPTSYNFSAGFLPAVTITGTQIPGTTESIPVIPGNPTATATNIEEAFAQAATDSAPNGVVQPPWLFSEEGPYTTPPVVTSTAPSVTVTPVSANPLQFDVTFVGASGDAVQSPLEVVNPLDSLGNPLTGGSVQVLKGPSPVFMVNNPDPSSAGLLVPLNYSRSNASVAMDDNGSFVVTWDQLDPNSQNPASVCDIYARRFQPVSYTSPASVQYVHGLETLGSQFQVNTFMANTMTETGIGIDGSGNFVIAWTGQGQDLSYFNGIIAQQFNSSGQRQGSEIHVDTEDTNVHIWPYVAVAHDGTFLVTWSSSSDPALIESDTYVGTVEARVFSSTGVTLVPQETIPGLAGISTASFDANDDYTVVAGTDAAVDNNGLTVEGQYGTEYQLFAANSTAVVNTVVRPLFMASNASQPPGTAATAIWPGNEYYGRVASDANGDLTVMYSGFGADSSDVNFTSAQAMALIEQQINATTNADLVPYLPGNINPLMYAIDDILDAGNVEGEIAEILYVAQSAGATDSQLGRLRAIVDSVLGVLDGEADGVYASTFPSNPVLKPGPATLQNSNILNATRDGNDDVDILDIPQFVVDNGADVPVAGGTVTLQLVNGDTGQFQNITVPIATTGGAPDTLVDPVGTAANIEAALDSAILVGKNWADVWPTAPTPPIYDGGPVCVRYILPNEVAVRTGTYWDVVAATGGAADDYYFEITFQGEVHDTPMSVAPIASTLHTQPTNEQQTLFIPEASSGLFNFEIGTPGAPTTQWLSTGSISGSPDVGPGAAAVQANLESVTGLGTVAVTDHTPQMHDFGAGPVACFTYSIAYVGADLGKAEPVPQFDPAPPVNVSGIGLVAQWNGTPGVVTENDPGNAASNPPLPADEIGGQTLGATPLYAKEFDGSAIGTKGAAETVASIAMEPNGSYVAVWTEDAQYTAGGTSNEDIEFRQFNESVDSVGPLVSGYLDPSGQPIAANAQLLQPLQYIVVDFDKSMDVPTVTNLNNWVLEQANGTPLVGGISQIYFGMNELQTLSQLSGTAGYSEFSTASPVGTNQWQAVLVLNGDGNSGGTAPLGAGQWTLVAKNSVLDYAGNPLGRNGWSVNGAPESISINIIKPSGGQTMINGNASDPVDGGSSNGSGGNTVASDGNGDFVAVFDLSSTTGAQAAGVYAKIYEMTYTDVNGTRTPAGPSPLAVTDPSTGGPWFDGEILVTNNTTATQVAVAESANGDFVVTWAEDDPASLGGWNVYYRAYNAAGQARSLAPIMVNSYTANAQNSPAVAMDAEGDFVITWQSDFEDGGSGYGIYCQRYDSQGNALGGTNELQVVDFTGTPTGSFELQWPAEGVEGVQTTTPITYTGNTAATATAIKAALNGVFLDANGKPLSVDVQAINLTEIDIEFTGAQGSLFEPLLNVVALNLSSSSPPGADITSAMQVPGASGELLVNDFTGGNCVQPAVAMDASGEFVISWTSYGEGTDGPDQSSIYAKKFPAVSTLESTNSTVGNLNAVYATESKSRSSTEYVVTVDSPANHVLNPNTSAAATGIVEVLAGPPGNQGEGSGTLLTTGDDILTAAHVVTDATGQAYPAADVSVTFNMPAAEGGPTTIQAAAVFVDPSYNGDPFQGGDVAVIELASPAPTGAQRYDIDRSTNAMDQAFTFDGYGVTGMGATGGVAPTSFPLTVLHQGENEFQVTGSQIFNYDPTLYSMLSGAPSFSSNLLCYNFSDGTPTHDAFGRMFGLPDVYFGDDEAMADHGDSGGPSLIDVGGKQVIAAVTTGGVPPPAANPSIEITAQPGGTQGLPTALGPSDFGYIGLNTSVEAYAPWIDSVTLNGGPEILVNSTNNVGRKWSSVAMDDNGEFAVSWTSYGQDGVGNGYGPGANGMNGVFARRFTSLGQPVTVPVIVNGAPVIVNGVPETEPEPEFQVNTFAANNQQHSKVAMDAVGDFTITWESYQEATPPSNAATSYGIYAQRYASEKAFNADFPNLVPGLGLNGEIGGEFPVNTTVFLNPITPYGNQRYPSIAMDDTGDTVIAWIGNGEDANPGDVNIGASDPQGFYYQQYQVTADTAGPTVDQVVNIVSTTTSPPQAQTVPPGVNLDVINPATKNPYPVTQFVVSFDENLSTAGGTSGEYSVTNPNNWDLTENGINLSGGIVSVQWGTAAQLGKNELNTLYSVFPQTNKWEAVITFDGTPAKTPNKAVALGQGTYVLTASSNIEDLFGNPLDGGLRDAASAYQLPFTIQLSTTTAEPVPPGAGAPGSAGAPTKDQQVNTTSTTNNLSPVVASDPGGAYVVVWEQYGAVATQSNIIAQLYDRFGVAQGGPISVNSYTTGLQVQPDVSMDGYGNFVVTWSGMGLNTAGNAVHGIWAREFEANGVPNPAGVFEVDQPIAVTPPSADTVSQPVIGMDPTGDFVIAWTSTGASVLQDGVLARIYTPAGTPLNNENQFFVAAPGTVNSVVQSPDVAMSRSAAFTVVWQSEVGNGSAWAVFGQCYAAGGVKEGGQFPVSPTTAAYTQVTPRVAMDPAGAFVVTWAGGLGNGAYGVDAQYYSPASATGPTASGGEIAVNQTSTNSRYEPDVSMDAAGDFVVTWATLGQDNPTAADWGICARVFSESGNASVAAVAALGEFIVNATVIGNQTSPSVAMDSYGNFTVAWMGPYAGQTALNGIFDRVVAVVPSSYASSGTGGTTDVAGVLSSYAAQPTKAGNGGTGIFVVSATTANGSFSFTGGPTLASWVVKLNGTKLTIPAGTTAIDFNGNGTDTVTINGTSATGESASITPGAVTFTDAGAGGTPYQVTAVNFPSATISTGGSGTLAVADNTGNYLLSMTPTTTTLTNGSKTTNQIVAKGFNKVTAIATGSGSSTTVSLLGGTGADTFTATPTSAILADTAGTYSLTANGFTTVRANGGTGNDKALLTDAAGGTFNATPTSAALTEPSGASITASNFESVQATAVGPHDTASLSGGAGSNSFVGSKAQSALSGVSYDNVAKGFYSVSVTGYATGYTTALLTDATGNATAIINPQSATLSAVAAGATSYKINLLSGFQVIDAIETLGTGGTATLNGATTAANVFTSTPNTANTATLTPAVGNAFREYVQGFSTIIANSANANDTANLYDTHGNDTFTGTPTTSTMSLSSGNIVTANGFKTVNAFSDNGGVDTANISGTTGRDTTTLRSTDALMSFGNGNSVHAWFFAKYSLVGGSSGNDAVTIVSPALVQAGQVTSPAGAAFIAWLSNFTQINETYSNPTSQQTIQATDKVFTADWT